MQKSIKKIITVLILLSLAAGLCAKSKKTIIKKIKREVISTKVETISSIVVLSPDAAEILTGMNADDLITAISEDSNVWGEENAKSVILDGEEDLENILSYKPDLVFLTEGKHRALEIALDERDVNWYEFDAWSIQKLEEQITEIGEMLGHETEALAIVTSMEEQLEKVRQAVKEYYEAPDAPAPVTIFYEESDDPLSTIGTRSFMHDLITNAGARNVFSNIHTANATIDPEFVIMQNPEVILVPAANGTTAEEIKAREGWQDISAVVNDRILIIDTSEYGKKSPSCIDAIYNLFELLK